MNWTQEENNIIKENFGKLTLRQIMSLLPNPRNYFAMRSHCQRLGLYRDRIKNSLPIKNTYDMEYFKTPSLVNSYVAGAISADGCIFLNPKSKSHYFFYKVAIKDEVIIEMLQEEFKTQSPKIYSESPSPHYSDRISKFVAISLSCFDKNAKYLKLHYNLVPQKTFRLGPTNLNNIYLNWAFLIGNIDGDGTISIAKGISGGKDYYYPYLHFCSASKKFIEWIKSLLDDYFPAETCSRLGWKPQVGDQEGYSRFTINGLRAAIIIDYLSQFPVPKLKRKWANPQVLDYIAIKKQQYPHLFKTLNLKELNDSISQSPASLVI